MTASVLKFICYTAVFQFASLYGNLIGLSSDMHTAALVCLMFLMLFAPQKYKI